MKLLKMSERFFFKQTVTSNMFGVLLSDIGLKVTHKLLKGPDIFVEM